MKQVRILTNNYNQDKFLYQINNEHYLSEDGKIMYKTKLHTEDNENFDFEVVISDMGNFTHTKLFKVT